MSRIEAKSEVTGAVWKIVAKSGDRVGEGDPLIIMESMKMEIPVLAEQEATVRQILVSEGAPVSEGQVVAILED